MMVKCSLEVVYYIQMINYFMPQGRNNDTCMCHMVTYLMTPRTNKFTNIVILLNF